MLQGPAAGTEGLRWFILPVSWPMLPSRSGEPPDQSDGPLFGPRTHPAYLHLFRPCTHCPIGRLLPRNPQGSPLTSLGRLLREMASGHGHETTPSSVPKGPPSPLYCASFFSVAHSGQFVLKSCLYSPPPRGPQLLTLHKDECFLKLFSVALLCRTVSNNYGLS